MPDSPALDLRLYETSVRPAILTFRDCIEHGMRFLGGTGTQASAQEEIRQAVISAYEELSLERRWRYYNKWGRIVLQSNQSDGTVAYTHSTRTLTLTGSTWPSNVTRGFVRIGSGSTQVLSKVQRKTSSTTLILDPTLNPGADVSSGATYEWFRTQYLLPPDFLSLDVPENQTRWWISRYVPHSQMVALHRYQYTSGNTWCFTITGQGGGFGACALEIWGTPGTIDSSNRTLDYAYTGMPFPLEINGFDKSDNYGKVSLTASSATVSGTGGTDWWSGQQGAVLRVSKDGTNLPTNNAGLNLARYTGIIETVGSTSSITLADANDGDAVLPSETVTSRAFVISDPVDIAPYMRQALYRGIERLLGNIRNMKDQDRREVAYVQALRHAAAKDGTLTHTRRYAGEGPGQWNYRLGRDGVVGSETNGN